MCLYDISPEQLQGAQDSIFQQLQSLEREGLLRSGQTAENLATAVTVTTDFQEAVKDAQYIQVHVQYCIHVPYF